jgi:hypothetical protein
LADTADLLKYLIAESRERDLPLVKTALVKLLYLADVEAVRRGLPRPSSVQWIYYKYGPYAFEIEDTIRHLVGFEIDEMARISASGYRYQTYRMPESTQLTLTPEEKALMNSVIERWAGQSLEELLNYVYFDTEPMLVAEWGQPLDFSVIPRRERRMELKEHVLRQGGKEAVERLQELKIRFWRAQEAAQRQRVRPTPAPRYDDTFRQALKVMDEEDLRGLDPEHSTRET